MIAIIGAGIAGLSLGLALSQRGATVTVLEADRVASGASGVATSYLEPRLGNTAMRALEREAMRRWPHYAAQLEEETGMSIGFRQDGQIKVSLQEYKSKLDKDLTLRTSQQETFKQLSGDDIRRMEPSLSPDLIAGAFLPDVCWVNGRDVCQALAVAIEKSGGMVVENDAVSSLQFRTGGVEISMQHGSVIGVEKTVLCAGIAATEIDGLPDDIPASRAVRGVNLVVDQTGLSQPITHLIKHHRGNLCPRENGQLIVGTTYESDQWSLDPTPEIIEFLYQNAEPILPSVRDLPLLKVTAGLRSKVGDGNLRLGCSEEQPQLFYSLSHGGAGFLRAPVIGDELAEFVLKGVKGPLTRHHTHG